MKNDTFDLEFVKNNLKFKSSLINQNYYVLHFFNSMEIEIKIDKMYEPIDDDIYILILDELNNNDNFKKLYLNSERKYKLEQLGLGQQFIEMDFTIKKTEN